MKNLILALAFIISAPAWSMIVSERTTLNHWNIDANSPLNEKEISSVAMFINHRAQTISLNLSLPWSCPDGMVCATVMPELTYSFEIESIDYNRCGIRQITARNDSSLIQIVDETTSHCPLQVNHTPITVDLFIKHATEYSNDRFYGDSFQSTYDFGIVEGNGSNARKIEIEQQQVIQIRPVSALR
jgi:hypothetical protein